jgi:hypothetical protein
MTNRATPLRPMQSAATAQTKEHKMENHVTKTRNENAVMTNEADNILSAAREDGFQKILKFKKGDYLIGEDKIPLGTEYLAHAGAWTKMWIKFVDGEVVDRKPYRVADGKRPADRNDLDDLDLVGQKDSDGKSIDPWVFQNLLPLEDVKTGELVVFATPSIGGQQAVRELCNAYARRVKSGQPGQPIIQLARTKMPTKSFGPVDRPEFKISGWDDSGTPENLAEIIPVKTTANDDMAADEIPF